MTGVMGLIQIALLAGVLFALSTALLCSGVYRRIRPALASIDPTRRAQLLMLLCLLPVVVGIGLTVVCFLPSTASVLWPSLDHCPLHHDGHPHFCLAHLPASAGSFVGWTLAGAFLGVVLLPAARRLASTLRSRRLLRQLIRWARRDETRGVWIAETEVPLAATTGIFKGEIVVSSGLLATLPADLVEAVLAHERAHVKRRDPLRKIVSGLVSLAHLPGVRKLLLEDLALATEQACDELAAVALGDRLRMAQAVLAVERLLAGCTPTFGLAAASFGDTFVAPRVEALVAPAHAELKRTAMSAWRLAALMLATLLAAGPIHHLTETILGLVAR